MSIPGHRVSGAFCDAQIAVRAHPGFTIVGVGAGSGLHYVFHAILEN
jgi:hypothetical protein